MAPAGFVASRHHLASAPAFSSCELNRGALNAPEGASCLWVELLGKWKQSCRKTSFLYLSVQFKYLSVLMYYFHTEYNAFLILDMSLWHRKSKWVGFRDGLTVNNPLANTGDVGSIPGSGRSPREGNGNPIQYSCLEDPMDRGVWQATVHGVTKSCTHWTIGKASLMTS